MRKEFLAFLVFALLLSACDGVIPALNDNPPSGLQGADSDTAQNAAGGNQPSDGQEAAPDSTDNTADPTEELSAPNCYGPDIHPVGQSIADQYEGVDYDQVMAWFCSGAEFEDILMALQTQKVSGQPAEDLLKRLAVGESWEEILASIDLGN